VRGPMREVASLLAGLNAVVGTVAAKTFAE
jgi:hypothetical protein